MLAGFRAAFSDRKVTYAVIVAALGYFVDVYDLLMFSILRVQSLKDLGLEGEELLSSGVLLLNAQMVGMLIGGVFWGMWGDKRGRIEVLFGTIIMYSLANIVNGFVTDVNQYVACRFISGIGLAGEIGAGITLVSELMKKEYRGYGTTLVAAVGVVAPAFAVLSAEFLEWRAAYIFGGVMGLMLLVLRFRVVESGLFRKMLEKGHNSMADVRLLLLPRCFTRYIACILMGVPIWAAVGLLVTFTPEIAEALGLGSDVKASWPVVLYSIGIGVGGMASGLLSQHWRSRKLPIVIFLLGLFAASILLLGGILPTVSAYYAMFLPIGFFMGYWVVFLVASAEQFGTNIRATVTTSVPNFVRGATVPMTLAMTALKEHFSMVASVQIVVSVVCLLGLIGVMSLRDTFDVDLDYMEERQTKKKKKA
ncbi:MAG: MFS transporter [Alphaproteobacteria bacterium]|nr:MFS transporter [Alphaproteobacteria bacterium]